MITINKDTDAVLASYKSIADGIASLFSPYAEVVIHELKSQQVIYIANNISKRKLGDDSALDDIGFEPEDVVIGPYEKLNWDGRKIRSVSVVVRDNNDQPAFVVCINVSISVFEDARNALDLFLSVTKLQAQPEKLFKDDWQERINTFLHNWLHLYQVSLPTLKQKQKKELVTALYHEGAFNGKSAADYIANVLSMGRATVFNYIKEAKNSGPPLKEVHIK